MTATLEDVRCRCGQMLFRGEVKCVEIKCRICKTIWRFEEGQLGRMIDPGR